ncbi:PEP/pyruvate-binding domain-containing protein [Desulfoferrobacter suflitae]|uniref:PEP/pyruvate-binding domain-containing protein n=1 Tax=Desulfoferrobacter suflitae TaxID=2865782 RepID=UPI002164EFF1|nr:PEP/pyruvate-binding domain-containing protein [Desulfoferrobacter suflitae]MCK8602741.1 PEP-utilizing enzyme [Desulfoferrobacter suflitae]
MIRLNDDAALDPNLVGHKFASLARAHRAGMRVPAAIAVSVEAHRLFLRHREWSHDMLQEVLHAAAELDLTRGLAIRSSAAVEDLPGGSFAGQYRTFLNVKDQAAVTEKIELCWASSQDVAEFYRARFVGGDEAHNSNPLMGVVLQKMVQAKYAGVAFSRNPMFPRRTEVVIEAVEGLGEPLVSGRITPCRAFVREGRKVRTEFPSDPQSKRRCALSTRQWREIASLAHRAEQLAMGLPQDIEWALDADGVVWLLQSRPITTIQDVDRHAPAGIWTRKIADDLWADRLTPFLADAMLANAPRFDLSRYARLLGIQTISPSLAVINGFLYVSGEALQQVLQLIPNRFRTTDLRVLLPPGLEADVTSPAVPKLASFLARCVVLPWIDPQANPFLCRRLTTRRMKKLGERLQAIKPRPPNATPQELLDRVQAAVELMANLQELNQWPYSYATILTWLLRWLVEDVGRLPHADFLELLSAGGNNVSVRIEAELTRIAAIIRRHDELNRLLREFPVDELNHVLPPVIRHELNCFLNRFGARSRHRTLYVERWSEAPEQVIGMLALLAKEPPGKLKTSGNRFKSVVNRLSPALRLVARPVCRSTVKYLDLREDLRFFLDQVLYLMRTSLLDLGRELGLDGNAMFLTLDELSSVLAGRASVAEAERLAMLRCKEFRQECEPCTYYVDGRPINELFPNAQIIRGVGTSPGRVSGPARIVADPGRSHLGKGDVLVAKSTDPGWTPILSVVAAIVAEEGGLLNHCSIVARELGIPAVVGVRGATRRIREGASITVDGDLGLVQWGRSPL